MSQTYPASLRYSKDHEWIEAKAQKNLRVGVTHFAIEQLGDIVHMELPKVGAVLKAGDSFGTIESTKTVSDLYAPVGGKVVSVNSGLLKQPESLQTDAYDKGWLIELEASSSNEIESLMSAEAYSKYVGS